MLRTGTDIKQTARTGIPFVWEEINQHHTSCRLLCRNSFLHTFDTWRKNWNFCSRSRSSIQSAFCSLCKLQWQEGCCDVRGNNIRKCRNNIMNIILATEIGTSRLHIIFVSQWTACIVVLSECIVMWYRLLCF